MRTTTFLTVLAAALLAAPMALAHGPHGGRGMDGPGRGFGGPGMGRGFERCLMAPEVNLTDAQKDKLKAMRQDGRAEAMKAFREIRGLREDLHDAFVDPSVSPAAVKAKAETLAAAMEKARSKFVDHVLQIRALLTPDQLKAMADLPQCAFPGHPMTDDGPAPGGDEPPAEPQP